MPVTSQDIVDAYNTATEKQVIRKLAGDGLEAVDAQDSSFGANNDVFAYKEDDEWVSKTAAEIETILDIQTASLSGQEAVRVATAVAYADQHRPTHFQHACATAWHASNEAWVLRGSNRALTRMYIPPVSMLNGGVIECYFAGETYGSVSGESVAFVLNVSTERDITLIGGSNLLKTFGFQYDTIGPFFGKLIIMPMGRYQTLLRLEMWFGPGSSSDISGPDDKMWEQVIIDAQPTTGGLIQINAGNAQVGDKIDIDDGRGDPYRFEFNDLDTTSDVEVDRGANNQEALDNLRDAIHNSPLYIKADRSTSVLSLSRIKGGTDYMAHTPAVTEILDSGSNMTITDFSTAAANDGVVDWEAGTDIFLSARRQTSPGGMFIGSNCVFQRGVTRGWEPRT